MLPGKKYTIEDVVAILRRQWYLFLLPLVLGAAAGVFAYKRLPVEYKSEALVMVIPQRIPDSYVKSTVTTSIEDHVRSVRELIMSRSTLEPIIRGFDLYKRERARSLMEDLVGEMRRDIDVKLQEGASSFRISYSSPSPALAQRVTERLASLVIEGNARDREDAADSANTFLESQLQEAKRQLEAQEKKLEEYQRQHAGTLPSQLQTNMQAIQSAQSQLQSLAESMNRARERRLLVERQIADIQALPVEAAVPGAGTVPDGGAGIPLTQQLATARAQLDELKLRYKPTYPDVIKAEATVQSLEAKVAREGRDGHAAQPALSPAEIARRSRIKDLEAERDVIDHQLATGQDEDAALKKSIADYQSKVDVLPARESDLVKLTRDYNTLQEAYSTLLRKKEDAKVAANLERRQIGEQLKILDPPLRPERPSNERQRLAALLGCPFAGLAMGVLLAGFLEYRDSSFKCEDDVLRVMSLPVLALIPAMDSRDDRRRERRTRRHGDGGARSRGQASRVGAILDVTPPSRRRRVDA